MKKEDILKLPIYLNKKSEYLTKKDIVTNFPNNFNIKKEGNYEYATTSGTTSDRMEIIRKPNWWQDEYKRTYANNELLLHYLKEGLHKVIFTTAQCSNLICFIDKPPLEKRIIGNTLYVNNTFNPWTWSKEDIKNIIYELNYFKPFYMDADPVYLAVFLYLKEKYKIKTKLHIPKIITLSYEYVTENVKKYISKHYNTTILNLYGTTEFGYIFLENKENKMQLCKDLVEVKLKEINKKNNLYSLIIDSYKNEYMPLLDYKVGDLVVASEEQVKNFKKDYIVEKMAGREKDLFNNSISYSMIDEIISSNLPNILFYQIYIITEKKAILKYITLEDEEINQYEENHVKKLLKNIGLNIEINFSKTTEIPPEISGKFAIIKRSI